MLDQIVETGRDVDQAGGADTVMSPERSVERRVNVAHDADHVVVATPVADHLRLVPQPLLDKPHRELLRLGAYPLQVQRAPPLKRGCQRLQLPDDRIDLLVRGGYDGPFPALHPQ